MSNRMLGGECSSIEVEILFLDLEIWKPGYAAKERLF